MPSEMKLLDSLFDTSQENAFVDQLFPEPKKQPEVPTAELEELASSLHREAIGENIEQAPVAFSPLGGTVGLKNVLGRSLQEYDTMKSSPLISDEFKKGFMQTLKGYGALAQQPMEAVRGVADFLMNVPGFALGILNGTKNALERLGRPATLNDLYDAASEGMHEATKLWKENMVEPVIGKAAPESELVGATFMAPAAGLSMLGQALSKEFEGYPNVQGAVKFAGDIAGLYSLKRIYHGRAGGEVAVEEQVKSISDRAKEIVEKQKLVDETEDEAIQRTQQRIIEVEKQKLEREAEEVQKNLDYAQMIKEDLQAKTQRVKQIKQAKKDIADEQINKVLEKIAEKEGKSLAKMLITNAEKVELRKRGFTDEQIKEMKPHEAAIELEKKFTPEKEVKVKEPIEEEPITEVDEQTGREAEELAPERSPFVETKERTDFLKEQFAERNWKDDIELVIQKLLNDVNRWRYGDDSVDIEGVRNNLSAFATRADEFRGEFTDPSYFADWKDVVREAASWARRAERAPTGDLGKIILPSEEVSADLAKIKALEDRYGKPIDQISDAEIELFTVEQAAKGVDWFGEGETTLNVGIPVQGIPKTVADLVKKMKGAYEKGDKLYGPINKVLRNADIFRKTGFWLGKDMKWRFEADDSKAMYRLPRELRDAAAEGRAVSYPLKDALHYPELYEAVQAMKNLLLQIDPSMDSLGQFDKAKGVIKLKHFGDKSALLHEVQHAVNEYTGSPFTGTNVTYEGFKAKLDFLNRLKEVATGPEIKRIDEVMMSYERGVVTPEEAVMVIIARIKDHEPKVQNEILDSVEKYFEQTATERYWTNPGEMEARLTQVRRDMTQEQRRAVPPWETLDRMLMGENVKYEHAGVRVSVEHGQKLYSGLPVDKIAKELIKLGKRAKQYSVDAEGLNKINWKDAADRIKKEFNRDWIDRSGNIRKGLLDRFGNVGYDILQRMYLAKGASSISANMLRQMRKEVYGGLSREEKKVLNRLIFHRRIMDIGSYKGADKFKYFKDHPVDESIAYYELPWKFENISREKAAVLKARAEAYFEWMKKPLKDMLDAGIITEESFNNLITHQYRRLELVDIFDNRYQMKIGPKRLTVWDSGVQSLASGRKTDIFEQNAEIMALEVFNRSYGRIMRNNANLNLLEFARSHPDNEFARVKTKGNPIPSGWQRIYAFEDGERKPMYLSPEMAKEWITNSPEISYKASQLIRILSGSPILRTFATGINWGFALANLPRDVLHAWFTARVYENGKWKMVYNPNMPIFLPQMGRDLATVFLDAALRGKRYQSYIREGGGMEFMVHQGRLLSRGRRLETPLDTVQNWLGYFGETSEIMTRLAIRERVIRRRARQLGISMEEARKKNDITREATFAARDYMDFGQGGGIAKVVDNGFPYFNAAVQGTRGLARAARDNPIATGYKIAQLATLTTGIYLASKTHAPKTTEELKYSVDSQNNICIPFPDSFRFIDDNGVERGFYLKIPLDPGQKFFKKFFEAATDKWLGEDIDVNGVVDSLKQLSPANVGEMPPSMDALIGYATNKDFWLNEDIWRRTDKPFGYQLPKWLTGKPIGGSEEEYIPGKTPQAAIDIGKATGLSPERLSHSIKSLFTTGTIWSWLLGQGYDSVFGEMPKAKKEQHLAMTLHQVPGIKRFIGVTRPYTKHAQMVERAGEKADIESWIQTRGLDMRAEGYLFEKNISRSDVYKYIGSFKDSAVEERLMKRFEFQELVRDLPERSFWLRLQGLKVPARAEAYVRRMEKAKPEEHSQIAKELNIMGAAGGTFSPQFWAEVEKFRREQRH